MLTVNISLETVGKTVSWLVSSDRLTELERAVQAGELGAARILKVDPIHPASSALRRALTLPRFEVAS